MIDYFLSSPEAIAALLIALATFSTSTIVLLITWFRDFPIVVRLLEARRLVFVDSALHDRVKISFEYKDGARNVSELRQLDFEIYNSHPRHRREAETITIGLPDAKITVLGISVANTDQRTPHLGGREVVARIVQVPVDPVDPLIRYAQSTTYPAVVVLIPYLEKAPMLDRVLLRITYDGPPVNFVTRGAKGTTYHTFYRRQRRLLNSIAIVSYVIAFSLMFLSYAVVGLPIFQTEPFTTPH